MPSISGETGEIGEWAPDLGEVLDIDGVDGVPASGGVAGTAIRIEPAASPAGASSLCDALEPCSISRLALATTLSGDLGDAIVACGSREQGRGSLEPMSASSRLKSETSHSKTALVASSGRVRERASRWCSRWTVVGGVLQNFARARSRAVLL